MITVWPVSCLTPELLEAPHLPPLCLECTWFPYGEAFLRMLSWENNVLLRSSGWYMCLNMFLNSDGWVWRLISLSTAQDKLCKSPCLLNLLPISLEWSASFVGLSLPSVYGDQFVNQHLLGLNIFGLNKRK